MNKIHHLRNGIAVISIPVPSIHSITLLVGVKAGSRHEDDSSRGMAHFLEHMTFKGTQKRPNSNAITIELDRHGAYHNAMTGKEDTTFFVKIAAAQKYLALDIIEDILKNSVFSSEDIEMEKETVCEEILGYEDDPQSILFEFSSMNVFPNSTLGLPIGGTTDSVRAFNRKTLMDYRSSRYGSNTMTVVVSGNFTPEFLQKVYNTFETFSPVSGPDYEHFDASKVVLPRHSIRHHDVKQIGSVFSFYGPSHTDKHKRAANILAGLLGGYSSSRLFQTIREDNGLAYSVAAASQPHPDTGSFIIYVGSDKEKFHKAYDLVFKVLKDVKDNGVTAEEFDRAKSSIIGSLALQLEDSSHMADSYCKLWMHQSRFESFEEHVAHYEKVTIDEVNDAANMIFNENYNVSIVAPEDFKLDR